MNCKHPRLGMSRPGPSDMVSFLRGPNRRLVHLYPPGDRRSFQTFPNPNQLQKIDSKSQHLQPHQAPTRPYQALPGSTIPSTTLPKCAKVPGSSASTYDRVLVALPGAHEHAPHSDLTGPEKNEETHRPIDKKQQAL